MNERVNIRFLLRWLIRISFEFGLVTWCGTREVNSNNNNDKKLVVDTLPFSPNTIAGMAIFVWLLSCPFHCTNILLALMRDQFFAQSLNSFFLLRAATATKWNDSDSDHFQNRENPYCSAIIIFVFYVVFTFNMTWKLSV